MKFGDVVEYDLRASHGGAIETAVCIGVPRYSRGYDDVLHLATGNHIGMPINACYCTAVGSDVAAAERYRQRWVAKFPDFLAPVA